VQSLAGLFRYTLKVADTGPVALQEELDFTRSYLDIERARFGERLNVVWNVDPGALRVPVPGLILQPLVENAVGHGLAPRAEGGKLEIRCGIDENRLRIEVIDDGVGLDGPVVDVADDGHGLGNVRQRLDVFYKGGASLELLGRTGGQGTIARVVLPALHDREKAS